MRLLLLLCLLATPALARPIKVCIVGDSIQAGFSPATHGVGTPLAALHPSEDFGVKNVAHSGDKVADFQTLWRRECEGRGYTDTIIGGPTNSLVDGDAAADIYAVTNAIATAAEAAGQEVIFFGILPRGTGAAYSTGLETRRLAYNALAAARAGSTYVDTDTGLRGTASGTAWVLSTAYTAGVVRVNGGKAYVCTTSGTSASSGGPTGTGTGITDGTAVWSFAPALGTEYGGSTDGLHPDNTGQARVAALVDAAVVW